MNPKDHRSTDQKIKFLCVKGIEFDSVSTICQLDVGIVFHFFFFIYIGINYRRLLRWFLMSLTTIYQLYRRDQLYWLLKPKYGEKTTDLPQGTDVKADSIK